MTESRAKSAWDDCVRRWGARTGAEEVQREGDGVEVLDAARDVRDHDVVAGTHFGDGPGRPCGQACGVMSCQACVTLRW